MNDLERIVEEMIKVSVVIDIVCNVIEKSTDIKINNLMRYALFLKILKI